MKIERLDTNGWERLKQVRLQALQDAPDAFGSTYSDALQIADEGWERQLRQLPTFLAVRQGEDVGMARGAPEVGDGDTALLISMWVAPKARGSGAGERLIAAVANWARQSGFARLILDVADRNAPAIALYERCGFHPTGETGALPPPRSHVLEHRRALKL
jgi:GNAT superfamily N-acetyltransferase